MATIWDQWAAIPGWQQVQASQKYLQETPSFQQKVHDILFKYGVDPGNQAGMAGTSVDFTKDPYSVVNLLKKTQMGANHDTINAANAAGLEESGAAAAGLNANEQDYNKNYAQAVQSEGSELSGALGDYTSLVGGMFDDAEKNPSIPAPGTAPPAPVGGPNTPVTSSASFSMPGADISGAKAAAAAASKASTVAQKLKPKTLTGITGGLGLGHVT